MTTKLKFQIDFYNSMDVDDDGVLSEDYRIYITFLDKDDRFEAHPELGLVLSYNGSGTFNIKSLWDERFGGITHNGILIPTLDKMGVCHEKKFKNDMDRYEFLKQLYVSVNEWADYWWGFQYDDSSKLTIKDNIWEVTCDTVYGGSLASLSHRVNFF